MIKKQTLIVFIFLCASFLGVGQASDLIISEYGEGSSNNKYLEIYNGTGTSVDLSNYKIWKVSNGGTWPEATINLSGTLSDGDVYIIANPSSNASILAVTDFTSGVVDWNGDDSVGLIRSGVLIDVIGTDGADPGTGWNVAGTTNATADRTLVRKNTICDPNTNWISSAGTSASDSEWVVYGQDEWAYLGSHTGNCFTSTDTIDWCNLQFPEVGKITTGGIFDVYARVYEPGITPGAGQGANITVWIGYNTSDTNPNTWSNDNWIEANYNSTCADGCNGGQDDEYFIDIGSYVVDPGIYYFASRVQYNGGPYSYGGILADGTAGSIWDGLSYKSGVLNVNPQSCSELFISEYVEGSSDNKFLEIYNPNSTSVTLSGVYYIKIYSNGSSTETTTINLDGTITPNGVFIIENSNETLGVNSNQSSSALNFNGNDVVALVKNSVIIDVIGQIGFDPGSEWIGSFCSEGTSEGTLIRNSSVEYGDIDGSNTFDPDIEWTCYSQNNISDLGFHTSSCVSTNELQLQEPIGTDIACGYTYNFGSQNIDTNTDFTFKIKNIGTTDLTINSLSFVNGTEYTLVNPPTTPFIISGGTNQDIVIRYRPLSIGLHLDTLTLNNDDSSEKNCSINFEGIGSTACATTTQIINQQDFESSVSDTWNYTANHTEIVDYWYVTNSLINIPSAESNSNFWGITDLDRSGHRTEDFPHEIIFDAVDISSYKNVQLSFYYFTINVDNSDDFEYELFYDSISQGRINISANTNAWNQVIVNIPNSVNSIQIIFYANLDAGNDNAGLDNFTLTSTTINTTTWTSSGWTPTPPNINTIAIIDYDYITNVTNGSFSACSLIVNDGFTLNIADGYFVEIENNITVNGNVIVQPKGAFVQINDDGIVDGAVLSDKTKIVVAKKTTKANNWYEYTYWSSPVVGETIGEGLFESSSNRRFLFKAQSYLDHCAETNNNNICDDNGGLGLQDGIDDDNNDWQWVNGATVMQPGVGYASTHNSTIFGSTPGCPGPTCSIEYTFEGQFNNGEITVPVFRNDSEMNDTNSNFIGNPYPSAIDVDEFFNLNAYTLNASGALEGVIYLWSQNTLPSSTANGNQNLNFSDLDYAIINGVDGTAGGDGLIPERFIPSGQGFFVNYSNDGATISVNGDIKTGEVIFNNRMRMADETSNSQFFRTSGVAKTKKTANKIWVNLTSDIGVFSQILVGYVNGATNSNDGVFYDATRNLSPKTASALYSIIPNDDTKFAIQGKDPNSLNLDEIIPLGFYTAITGATIYKLSIAQFNGDFFNTNTVYLKDYYMNIVHNLSESDYSFTSEVGEFKDRFEMVFQSEALSDIEAQFNIKNLSIIELEDGRVQFKTNTNFTIAKVRILDLLGRTLYELKGTNTSEIYNLNNLSQSAYIAKVELSNGQIITKKAIKRK